MAKLGNGRVLHLIRSQELVIVTLLNSKRPLTEISTFTCENEAGYLMWELKGAAVGII